MTEAAVCAHRTHEAYHGDGGPWADTTYLPGGRGFVRRQGKVVLVVFRGTEGVRDWLRNADVRPSRLDFLGERVRVHRGFEDQYHAVRAHVSMAIGRHYQRGDDVVFTGHSLGGALAQLAAVDLATNGGGPVPTRVYTFGSPRVGDGRWVRAYDRTIGEGKTVRFVFQRDPVPRYDNAASAHAGPDYKMRADGSRMGTAAGSWDRVAGWLENRVRDLSLASMRDHAVDNYIGAVMRASVNGRSL